MDSPLKRLRQATALSAYAFAQEVGITITYYYRLESGDVDMRSSTASRIASELSKKLDRTYESVLAELMPEELAALA